MYKSHQTGFIGEEIATRFLIKQGFTILGRNYRKKFGEIDIIGHKDNKVHFFEVKSVTCVTLEDINRKGSHQPEDNVHELKRRRLARVIQAYLFQHYKTTEVSFEVSVVCVFMDHRVRKARIKLISNIII